MDGGLVDRTVGWGNWGEKHVRSQRQITVNRDRQLLIGGYCLLRRCHAVALSFHPVHCFLLLITLFPFSSKENQQIPERAHLGPPVIPGVRRSVCDPETIAQERRYVGTWPNEEWRYSTRSAVLSYAGPRAPRPDRAFYLPTFSHFLTVNKTSLPPTPPPLLPPLPSPSSSTSFSTL